MNGLESGDLRYENGQPVVYVTSETANKLLEQYGKKIAESGKPPILDFSKARYISSTGVGQILALYAELQEGGIDSIRLRNLSSSHLKIFSLIGLDTAEGIEIEGLDGTVAKLSKEGAKPTE